MDDSNGNWSIICGSNLKIFNFNIGLGENTILKSINYWSMMGNLFLMYLRYPASLISRLEYGTN
jgi:hypothetical protein